MTDGIASGYDRFAAWPKTAARAALLALVALLVASAIVPIRAAEQKIATVTLAQQIRGETGTPRPRDDDLALYDRVIERIGKGENYYTVAAEEHRRSHYPLRPGVAVRLPTLAYLLAWLGDGGQVAASALLVLAVLAAWWRRLGEEPGGADRRMIAMALLALGASLGLNRYFFTLHELWSGMLLALAFGLHRPGRKWGAALAVAALALAIREHALPFVLLMAAMALWRRD